MQFVAEDPVHVVIRNEKDPLYDTGGRQITTLQRHVYAKFQRGTAPEWARRQALDLFEFRKMPEGVTTDQWIAYYDSTEDQHVRGWTDEEVQAIEEKLVQTHSVVRVEAPKPALPYPSFERDRRTQGQRKIEHAIADILATLDRAGTDPQTVIDYEAANQNDIRVIDALAALLVTEKEEDEPVIAA